MSEGPPGRLLEIPNNRSEQVVAAAARLFGTRGYHQVGIDDIGLEIGISGPAVYKHFRSKHSILVGIFDRVVEHLLTEAQRIRAGTSDPATALDALIDLHLTLVVDHRAVVVVYDQEAPNLPAADRARLRREMRRYVDEWIPPVAALRPDLDEPRARAAVHAVIRMAQSPAIFHTSLEPDALTTLLSDMARAALRDGHRPARRS
ncbi:TetR family transcriptional regulator [Actinomycetospora sp. NBRC 106375]|uniref:TetR/AcrR family transcriptional regulator n=1 Tax=Actinomycetospora sp. NBRC 106375 TaxID=3032207 RepID=UPI0024A23F0D|nr:TetR/AcrR family transcriptional regulator [Actinomycetospora sp. NBRC 106375]GLZ50234.1 TetR family transcriptional regulator [Actinomycetospora sp. NBRC 106375]